MERLSEQPTRHHEAAHQSFDISPPDGGVPQQPMDDHPVLSELYPESERPEHQVQRQGDQDHSNGPGDFVHDREGNHPEPEHGVCDACIQGRTHGNHAAYCPWDPAQVRVEGERRLASADNHTRTLPTSVPRTNPNLAASERVRTAESAGDWATFRRRSGGGPDGLRIRMPPP